MRDIRYTSSPLLASKTPVWRSKFIVAMLALAFLVLIGVALIAESVHSPIDRKIIYGAMAFSVLVEMVNLRAARNRGRRNPVPHQDSGGGASPNKARE